MKIEVDIEVIRDAFILADKVVKIANKVPKFIFDPTKDPEFKRLEEYKETLIQILKENK